MASEEFKPTALVVDDHRFSRKVLTRILADGGFEVASVASAAEALRWAGERVPDAFLLDAEMPEIDGIELCRRLRAQPHLRITPIIVTTASQDRTMLTAAFNAGCDDFLVKPLEPVVVLARLDNVLKKAHYSRDLEAARRELARYVSPRISKLVERGLAERGASDNEPALIHACVLFTDIRGFTAMARNVVPQTLFHAVSEHLGTQVECVYRHRGYVDKFGGDGVMAIFDGEGMASDACRCAVEIMARVPKLSWLTAESVPMGIGIHYGPAVVGQIGHGEHLDYTAIGDTVNIAARLCGQASSSDIIVSSRVRELLANRQDLSFERPQSVMLRGLEEPFMLYHLRAGAVAE